MHARMYNYVFLSMCASICSFAQSAYRYLERVAGRAPRDDDAADKRFQRAHVDWENVRQARANIIAGACLGLGFRFAGTADSRAFEVV